MVVVNLGPIRLAPRNMTRLSARSSILQWRGERTAIGERGERQKTDAESAQVVRLHRYALTIKHTRYCRRARRGPTRRFRLRFGGRVLRFECPLVGHWQ